MQRPVEPPPSRWQLPDDAPVDPGGLVAIGADLEPGTLLAAYRQGLFPMPVDRRRIAWFSPDPRAVLPLDGLRVSRSLARSLRRYEIRVDTVFRTVMEQCADPRRSGAWLNRAFIDAYCRLHELGWATSVETWSDGHLVGGLYGVRIERFFAGEAMFHHATDASKVALVHLVERLRHEGCELLDVQWSTAHLVSLGVIEIARTEYLDRLGAAISPRQNPSGAGTLLS